MHDVVDRVGSSRSFLSIMFSHRLSFQNFDGKGQKGTGLAGLSMECAKILVSFALSRQLLGRMLWKQLYQFMLFDQFSCGFTNAHVVLGICRVDGLVKSLEIACGYPTNLAGPTSG